VALTDKATGEIPNVYEITKIIEAAGPRTWTAHGDVCCDY